MRAFASPSAFPGGVEGEGEAVLRSLDWGEVTARLNAARDLRRELCAGHGAGEGAANPFGLAADRYLSSRVRCGVPGARDGESGTVSKAGPPHQALEGELSEINPAALDGPHASGAGVPAATGPGEAGPAGIADRVAAGETKSGARDER